jgi:hypothetical protein
MRAIERQARRPPRAGEGDVDDAGLRNGAPILAVTRFSRGLRESSRASESSLRWLIRLVCNARQRLVAPGATWFRMPKRKRPHAYRNRIFLGARCQNFVAMTRGTRAFARAARRESTNRSD